MKDDERSIQILKCHDDHAPVCFSINNEGTEGIPSFKLEEGSHCPWVKKEDQFGPDKLRSRIEPWLTALFQSEHLSVLVGSGLTQGLHQMAAGEQLSGMNEATFGIFDKEINTKAKDSAISAGRTKINIEDQIRVSNELLRGLEVLASTKSTDSKEYEDVATLQQALTSVLDDFTKSILKGENGLISAEIEKREKAFNYLVSFLMSFASRSGTRDRLHIFTTNYDRCIEAGADVAGLRLIDRFVGTLVPIFRSSRLDVDMHYNPPGIRGEPRYLEGVARFTKLHGSVDWIDYNKNIQRIGLPFGAEEIDPYLNAPGLKDANALQLMIYPNASKDRETASYPYVELFRDLAAAICRPNSTLICYGYSFGDEHINRVIEDMLTIPSAHLVIISYGDPLGRIMYTYEKLGRPAQITLLIGDHLGDFQTLVDHYLPKPAIDRTTFRMAELLKARWGTVQNDEDAKTPKPTPEGDTVQ
ncbi:fibronectin-binding protein (FBP) [Methanomicrobiaceae archaeon CYW5]|uniref:SIR2 family protein n=1 Tax=Methanovulcanius yangii TaxID=1789227 RepID=UPI0029CA339F|nr:SIR2 family protein [Methanovulcanius yangii]MBT8508717.1 fibronectin-binding protein (FBP) [Methanovulcanius yangii]